MTISVCRALNAGTLLSYWLGELDVDHEARAEEHLLACAACSQRLGRLVALADEVRALARAGGVSVALTADFARRLAERGLRLREYRLPWNGSVECTVKPEDDLVIARLEAPLAGVRRLDVIETDHEGRTRRAEDVPFQGSELVLAQHMDILRSLPKSTLRVRLLAIEPQGERVVGEYTFNHTPSS